MFDMRFLVVAMVLLRLTEKLAKGWDVRGVSPHRLPFTTGKSRRDFLHEPAVSVWILKRGKRVIGPTLRVAPNDARILLGVVERPLA